MNVKVAANFVISVRNASTKPTTNGFIKPFVYNRNPRNLEKLRLAIKPKGFYVDNKDVEYWHRLRIHQHAKFVVAKIEHNTGTIVVEASTNEWAIRKMLYSAKDKQAHIILAKVFAERCLESGITSFKCSAYKDNTESSNISAFIETLEEEGLILEEASLFDIHDIWKIKREKRPWMVVE